MAAAGRAPIGCLSCRVESSVRLYEKKWCGHVWQGAKNETKTLGKPRVSRSRRGGKTDPTGTGHCAAHAGPPRDAISGPQRPRSRVKVAVFTPDKMAELLWRTTHKTHPADVNTMKSASCVAPEHSERWVPFKPPAHGPPTPLGPPPVLRRAAACYVVLYLGPPGCRSDFSLRRIGVDVEAGAPRIGAAGTPSASKRRRRGKGSITDGLRRRSRVRPFPYVGRINFHRLVGTSRFSCRSVALFLPLIKYKCEVIRSWRNRVCRSVALIAPKMRRTLMARLIIYLQFSQWEFNITKRTSVFIAHSKGLCSHVQKIRATC